MTFMVVTFPLASISASGSTLRDSCWVFGCEGYAGATLHSSSAGFTSPPTGSGATGAEGCLLPPTRPALSASAPESGWSSFVKVMPASGSPLFCALRLELTFGAARWTSPRTGFFGCSTSAGAAAAEEVDRAPLFAGFELGCELRGVVTDETAGTMLRVFDAELAGAEVLVIPAGFDRRRAPGTCWARPGDF